MGPARIALRHHRAHQSRAAVFPARDAGLAGLPDPPRFADGAAHRPACAGSCLCSVADSECGPVSRIHPAAQHRRLRNVDGQPARRHRPSGRIDLPHVQPAGAGELSATRRGRLRPRQVPGGIGLHSRAPRGLSQAHDSPLLPLLVGDGQHRRLAHLRDPCPADHRARFRRPDACLPQGEACVRGPDGLAAAVVPDSLLHHAR